MSDTAVVEFFEALDRQPPATRQEMDALGERLADELREPGGKHKLDAVMVMLHRRTMRQRLGLGDR